MEQKSPVLVILNSDSQRPYANQLAALLGYPGANVVIGTGHDAAHYIESNQLSVKYIALFIGSRKLEVMAELDDLARVCEPGTQLVVAGETNDIQFYRALIERGVTDYFTTPVDIELMSKSLLKYGTGSTTNNSTVISFMSAAAGDGSSSVALNVGYALAKEFNAKTIIIDMDYQFGMTAKNLDLSSPFGIKELLEHPDRGIDSTLLQRMVVGYNSNLDIIAAPNELRFQPNIQPEVIRDLLNALQEKYKFIILDLPHIWSPWIASAFSYSDAIILVAQLWLKSVTHSSRMLNVWRDMGVNPQHIRVAINRSGAKYKEGVAIKDFERVCNIPISYFLPNDIKTVVTAENLGKTVIEVGKSRLAAEYINLAESLRSLKEPTNTPMTGKLAFSPHSTNKMG